MAIDEWKRDFKSYIDELCLLKDDYRLMMAYIDEGAGLLEGQEPKHGQWVRLTGMAPPEYHGHKVCSVCGCLAPYDPIHPWREELSRYCPGCGAEMEGEAE